MSDVLNFATLAENSAEHLQSIADRFGGKDPEPVDEPDPDAEGEEVNTEAAGEVLANLTEAETADLIEKAEAGNAVALDILERALEASKPEPLQAGDAGASGIGNKGRAISPWALAEKRIRKALALGRSRQVGY